VVFLDRHDRFRIERGTQHLHPLGGRVLAEFLAEGVCEGDDVRRLIARFQRYEPCSLGLIRALDGDRFVPSLRAVPL
jgi:hypothetical protein